MKHIRRQSLAGLSVLMLVAELQTSGLAAPRTEETLIKDLSSRLPVTVLSALKALETEHPNSTNAHSAIKKLLSDKRPTVRRKAARVLGAVHAPVDQNDINYICAFLKSSNDSEVEDGLLALRGLNVPQVVPEILPFLKSSNTHLVRDACRALAVLGNKDTIVLIEPLLKHPEAAVKKDAENAIASLRSKF